MCDATKCDDCNKHSHILYPVENSRKYVCLVCKEKAEKEEATK